MNHDPPPPWEPPGAVRGPGAEPQTAGVRETVYDSIIDIWQPASPRPLTREDAREIVANVVGLFTLLQQWAEQDALMASPGLEATTTPMPQPRRRKCP